MICKKQSFHPIWFSYFLSNWFDRGHPFKISWSVLFHWSVILKAADKISSFSVPCSLASRTWTLVVCYRLPICFTVSVEAFDVNVPSDLDCFRFSFVLWLIKTSSEETPLHVLALSSKHYSYWLILINSCFPPTLLCAMVTSLSPFSLVIPWIQVLWRIYPSRDIWKVLSKLLEPLI